MGRKKNHDVKDENLKPFSMSIPKDIHKKFKLKAIDRGRSMRDLLVDLMEEYVSDDSQAVDVPESEESANHTE